MSLKPGDRVQYWGANGGGATGTVVEFEECGRKYDGRGLIVRVDDGMWHEKWNKSHEPYYQWANEWEPISANEWELISASVWFPL